MNKSVIYTCLVGEYDKLIQPRSISRDFDYICFSNDIKCRKIGIWEICPIPFEHPDKTRLSRFVKLNPHIVLTDYDYSIWIDANIEITGDLLYRRVESLIHENVLVAQVQHPFYDCIYTDILECIRFHKDNFQLLIKQYNFLKKEGFPEHYGLFENNLIYRKHNHPQIIQVSQMWWKMYNQFAKRDQFSLCYVYWKLNIHPELIFASGISTRNCSDLCYYPHILNLSILERIKLKLDCLYYQIRLLLQKDNLLIR